MLAKLAQHYYRPDFTEGQARQLIRDYVEDLAEFSVSSLDEAVREYRRDAKSKFFPPVGRLRELAIAADKRNAEALRYAHQRPLPKETRPLMWWNLPFWRDHWHESEIPDEHRKEWARRNARKTA